MADEILWRAHLHPAKLPCHLSRIEADRLWQITREVAKDALRVIAPDWGEAPDDWLFNYRWKAGGICPRPHCRCQLARAELRGRTCCWCPGCQDFGQLVIRKMQFAAFSRRELSLSLGFGLSALGKPVTGSRPHRPSGYGLSFFTGLPPEERPEE